MRAARWISRALAGRGLAVLRFDSTGLGASDGEFAATITCWPVHRTLTGIIEIHTRKSHE